jgi:hypothetical protein
VRLNQALGDGQLYPDASTSVRWPIVEAADGFPGPILNLDGQAHATVADADH